MRAVGEKYQAFLQTKISSSRKPAIPFLSTVTCKVINQAGEFSAAYWRSNLESPVLFNTAVKSIIGLGVQNSLFLEIGPHSTLAGPLRQIFSRVGGNHAYISTLRRNNNGDKTLLSAVGHVYCYGHKLDFSIMQTSRNVLSDLPLYPWHYENKFWHESRLSRAYRHMIFPHHDILGSRVAEVNDFEPTWRNILKLDNVPWISDHKISTDIVFPAAGYIAMVGEAIRQLKGSEDYTVRNVTLTSALVLGISKDTELMTNLCPNRITVSLQSEWHDFTVNSYSAGAWTKHCVGQVRSGFETDKVDDPKVNTLPREVLAHHWYEAMLKVGLKYGPAFSGLSKISTGVNEHTAVADVVYSQGQDESPYSIHPAMLDPCFQLVTAALAYGQSRKLNQMCLPTSIDFLSIRKTPPGVRMFAENVESGKNVILGNTFGAANGEAVMRLRGLRLSPVENDVGHDTDSHAAMQLEWRPDIDFFLNKDLIRTVRILREVYMLEEKLTVLCILEASFHISSMKSDQPHINKYIA